MLGHIDTSLIDWSRAQFALTAIYHWIFVPLTLGLAVIMGIMETAYYRTGDEFWKRTAKFWMKIFGINFAIGVAVLFWNLNSVRIGVITVGLWATSSVRRLPSRVFWLSLWKQRLSPSCSSAGIR